MRRALIGYLGALSCFVAIDAVGRVVCAALTGLLLAIRARRRGVGAKSRVPSRPRRVHRRMLCG